MIKNIANFQVYAYFGVVVVLTIVLYVYIYYLYSMQKHGRKDFEKYSDMALKDDIHDTPVEDISHYKKKK